MARINADVLSWFVLVMACFAAGYASVDAIWSAHKAQPIVQISNSILLGLSLIALALLASHP